MLTIGFCLHNVSLPILKNNKNKKNNTRDLFYGYLLTLVCYIFVGTLGYLGFSSTSFKDTLGIQATQNCLNLFPPKHILAFIARIVILLQLIMIYPLLYHIMQIQIGSLFFKTDEMSPWTTGILNFTLIGFNTILGATYPQVGSIIGLLGSILGLNLMYIIPIAVYLKRYLLEISNHNLVEALDWNRIKTVHAKATKVTPKIAIYEDSEAISDNNTEDIAESDKGVDVSIKQKIKRMREKIQNKRRGQHRFFKKSQQKPLLEDYQQHDED